MAVANSMIASRRYDLDNLRTFLTSLVVVHHASIPYGGSARSILKSAIFHGPSPFLSAFNAINQSFFMAAFFWISGRMAAQSLSRSPPSRFLRDKALRLGIPTVVYTLTIVPLTLVLALPSWDIASVWQTFTEYWGDLDGVKGSAWYTSTLLLFDLITAFLVWHGKSRLGQAVSNTISSRLRQFQSSGLLDKWSWVAVALCSFLVRTSFPLGVASPPLNINLAYSPQYVFAYWLGYQSFSVGLPRMYGPFDTLSSGKGNGIAVWSAIFTSLVALPLIAVPTVFATGFSDLVKRVVSAVSGGWNLSALVYALWNEFSFVVITPALMTHFREYHNKPAESGWWRPRFSYAAYLVHNLVSMVVAIGVETVYKHLVSSSAWAKTMFSSTWWAVVGPLVLTAAVGAIQVYLSFVTGRWLVQEMPGVRRII